MAKSSPSGRSWLIGVIGGLIDGGLYLAFTSNAGWRELIAAVMTGTIATLATMVFATAGDVRFSFRLRDVIQAWRLPWYAIEGTFEVFEGLGKQLFSRGGAPSFLGAVRFEIGERESLKDAGRRALAITYTTATPNFVIIGFVEEQGLLLYHQIIPGEVRQMTRSMGANP